MSKNESYIRLVQSRKDCRLCKDLINPSECEDGIFDSDHIGPWSRWQGNLNAYILVVGQDWGDVDYFRNNQGYDSRNNPTNEVLRKLLSSIGVDINLPNRDSEAEGIIFLTNAILCLKEGGMGGKVKTVWFNQCGVNFLRPLVYTICPEIVVSLGKFAFNSFRRLYNFPKMDFHDAVNLENGFTLTHGERYFPMYHCSSRVLSNHRKIFQQMTDWQRVKEFL